MIVNNKSHFKYIGKHFYISINSHWKHLLGNIKKKQDFALKELKWFPFQYVYCIRCEQQSHQSVLV